MRREDDCRRQPYGQSGAATGDLLLSQVTADGRKVQCLQLLCADSACPRLFEPRLVALSAKIKRWSERADPKAA